MKKILSIILVFVCLVSLVGCQEDYEYTSFEEYVKCVNEYKGYYSTVELDQPKYFLPSDTFFKDYKYLDGQYYLYEFATFGTYDKTKTDKSFLRLTYEEEVYLLAKKCMLENIPKYGNNEYYYNDYVFYQNANFHSPEDFPNWFTMACYNDKNNTLIFLGMCDTYHSINKKFDDVTENWTEFIDAYYGEIYDFTK